MGSGKKGRQGGRNAQSLKPVSPARRLGIGIDAGACLLLFGGRNIIVRPRNGKSRRGRPACRPVGRRAKTLPGGPADAFDFMGMGRKGSDDSRSFRMTENLPSLEARIKEAMSAAGIPGVALALLRGGRVDNVITLGLRNVGAGAPVTERTVFEAASLSKPVFAYAVLRLADAGILSLDEPLPIDEKELGDPRARRITTRHVLSHMTGLPNWPSESRPLRTYFEPGERFSYSGEGFALLQAAVERKTGDTIEGIVGGLVFVPLRMLDSGYVWRASFDADYAAPHEDSFRPVAKFKPTRGNAAFSLHTTARDYGRFLEAVLSGEGLAPETARSWLEPTIHVPKQGFLSLDERPSPDLDAGVAWGLGWGLEPGADAFFHWGANDNARAYAIGRQSDGRGFVAFMNSDKGLAIVREIAGIAVPGEHPSLRWLGVVD